MDQIVGESSRPKPSELELQVLAVLWQHGPRTARQVLEALSDGKQRAYTTVLTVLQVMEKKGLLTHTRESGGGVAHVYKPAVSKRQVLRPLLRGLVDRVFGGSTAAAVQQLLEETDVSADEVTRIRAMLRERHKDERGERGRGGGSGSNSGSDE